MEIFTKRAGGAPLNQINVSAVARFRPKLIGSIRQGRHRQARLFAAGFRYGGRLLLLEVATIPREHGDEYRSRCQQQENFARTPTSRVELRAQFGRLLSHWT